jgi:hypothetical protein
MGVRARLPSRGLPQGAGGGAHESEEAALVRRSCPEHHPLTNQALIHFDAPAPFSPEGDGHRAFLDEVRESALPDEAPHPAGERS